MKGSDKTLRASYDRGAAVYDAARYDSAEGRLFTELEDSILRSWLALTPASKALDVPAGTGRFSLSLAESGATVVGVDISGNMLKMAGAKEPAPGHRAAYFAQGSGAQLPFADNTFDAVVSFKFFHLVPNERKPEFIREMTRVLKPGKSMVVEFNSPYYGGVLAWLRYTFRKRHSGGIRMKCIFPDQIPVLFQHLEITRQQGVKLPFSRILVAVLGRERTDSMSIWVGGLPGFKYLSYALMIEARKPA